jgi:flagellar biosynthesis/type III secretory pathway protein FliH
MARLQKSVLVAASQEARHELASAHERAKTIIAEAEQEARGIRAAAQAEGREAGAAELAAAWIRLRSEERARDEKDLDRLVELARAMAERLLGEALEMEPKRVLSLARQTLIFARQARRIVFRAHPEDGEVLERHLASLGLEAAAIEIHADESRARGSLLLDTDLGTLDANITIQLDRLARSLRDSFGP